jgi:hypothetical protein
VNCHSIISKVYGGEAHNVVCSAAHASLPYTGFNLLWGIGFAMLFIAVGMGLTEIARRGKQGGRS